MHTPDRLYRILYVGRDHFLLNFLNASLPNCRLVHCPDALTARILIQSAINYSLLLFDDHLPDSTATALSHFTLSLIHRQHTTIIIYKNSDDPSKIAAAITHLFATPRRKS